VHFSEDVPDKIDLSGKGLKKLDKAIGVQNQATVLILDDNELQRLDNVGTYTSLQKVCFSI
jgi:Leucine-rich repeat (LRR) protein